jgi:hypothetical protein
VSLAGRGQRLRDEDRRAIAVAAIARPGVAGLRRLGRSARRRHADDRVELPHVARQTEVGEGGARHAADDDGLCARERARDLVVGGPRHGRPGHVDLVVLRPAARRGDDRRRRPLPARDGCAEERVRRVAAIALNVDGDDGIFVLDAVDETEVRIRRLDDVRDLALGLAVARAQDAVGGRIRHARPVEIDPAVLPAADEIARRVGPESVRALERHRSTARDRQRIGLLDGGRADVVEVAGSVLGFVSTKVVPTISPRATGVVASVPREMRSDQSPRRAPTARRPGRHRPDRRGSGPSPDSSPPATLRARRSRRRRANPGDGSAWVGVS